MRENFANFLGVNFCNFVFCSLSLREFLLNFCEKIQGFCGFKDKNLRNLMFKCCEFFMALNLFKFLLNFCKKIQGFCEFKMRNSQNSRLFCFEFFKKFKQGYEFKRKIHAFTRIKSV